MGELYLISENNQPSASVEGVFYNKPPRCIAAGGGSVLIAQGVYARVSILRNL